jgi:RsiW-degrading membrane proteinase PrsW (M82 family)
VVGSLLFAIASSIGIVLSGFWLLFFLFEDRKDPEPTFLITRIFFLGMLAAGLAAYLEQTLASQVFPLLSVGRYSISSLLANGFLEELMKFLVVLFFIRYSKFLDEPIDLMIYMITAALGFAAVENLLFFHSVQSIEELIGLASLRFVGATLMHALASGLLGYFWAKRRLLFGFITVTLLHALFNYLILKVGPTIFPTILLVIMAIVMFADFDKLKDYYERRKFRKSF